MDLTLLQHSLRQFAAERDWQAFHTPKNLAMALMVEAAELAEIFQWLTPEQSQTAAHDKVEQDRIGDEVADVLLYLLQIADHCGVDLKRAVGRKLVKNARKHPPTRPGLPAGPMSLSAPATHVLVDWENVQPKEDEIRALVPEVSDVWIFHGRHQKKAGAHQQSFGDRLTLVEISRPGDNALDFHLTFYMGYITSRNPEARIVVLSNDQDYKPMLEHARTLGFDVAQLGFSRPRKTTATKTTTQKATPAAKKTAAKKSAAKKAAPAPALAKPPAPTKAAAKKTASKKTTASEAKPADTIETAASSKPSMMDKEYEHVLNALRKARNKPAREARLKGAVKSLLNGGKAEAAQVDAVIQRLVADGHVAIDGKGAVTLQQP